MIAAYIHFDLILFKVSIKIDRLILMTTSIELFKLIKEARRQVEFNKVQYKDAKKEAKRAVAVVKNNVYERLFHRLNAKGGENEVFKLTRARERRSRDLSGIRCIKDEEGRVLVEDAKVQERWQGYFCKLFNGKDLGISSQLSIWLKRNNNTTD